MQKNDSVICLDGAILPNEINFENIRESYTEKAMLEGEGDPLLSDQVGLFIKDAAPSYDF